MTVIHLDDGKEISIGSDPRTDTVRLLIHANRGSLGVDLDKETALRVSKMLWKAAR